MLERPASRPVVVRVPRRWPPSVTPAVLVRLGARSRSSVAARPPVELSEIVRRFKLSLMSTTRVRPFLPRGGVDLDQLGEVHGRAEDVRDGGPVGPEAVGRELEPAAGRLT